MSPIDVVKAVFPLDNYEVDPLDIPPEAFDNFVESSDNPSKLARMIGQTAVKKLAREAQEGSEKQFRDVHESNSTFSAISTNRKSKKRFGA